MGNAGPPPVLESFRPKSSWGWTWLLGTGLLMLGVLLLIVKGASMERIPFSVRLLYGVIIFIALWMFALAASFPFMRYELTPDALVLRYGVLLHFAIPYDTITEVEVRDLSPTWWSATRFPGLALYKVTYSDGPYLMCSTRMAKGVLVIETEGEDYGISPADEERLIAALKVRMAASRGGK